MFFMGAYSLTCIYVVICKKHRNANQFVTFNLFSVQELYQVRDRNLEIKENSLS